MSNENEHNPDELDFDINAIGRGGAADHSFADEDFDPFAENAFTSTPSMTDGDSVATPGTDDEVFGEISTGSADAGDFDFGAYTEESSEESAFPDFGVAAESTAATDPSDAFSMPSAFLTGNDPSEDAEAVAEGGIAPIVETDEKKGKKGEKGKKKEKKEKKPKPEKKKKEKGEPLELGALLSLILAVVLAIALIAGNVWTILFPPAGVGFMSTVCYLLGIDLFGLCGIMVPALFYVYRKDIDVFKTSLGVSVMALSLGTILLMTPLYHYDFDFKGASTLPGRRPSAAPPSAPPTEETPTPEAAPAENTPTDSGTETAEDLFGE